MTGEPRVLIVTRRYWPLANDTTFRLVHWASALNRQGNRVTILTTRWHARWPADFAFREMPVVRIEPAPTSPFRVGRYARAVARWIADRKDQFDLVYCDAVDVEAQAILAQSNSYGFPPVVVRFDPTEIIQPYSPDAAIPSRALLSCQRARLVVVPRPSAHQRLIAAGVHESRILRMADAPLTQVQRSESQRLAARNALADINHELLLRATDRLVVCPCDLDRRWAIETLVQAIGPLLEQHRFLRLWILGDGNFRDRLYEKLKYRGWHNLVNMPGSFEDIDEVMRAADLWLVPSQGSGVGWLVPTAIVSNLATIVCDSPDVKHWLASDQNHLAFRNGDAKQLSQLLQSWLDSPRTLIDATTRVRSRIIESARPLDAWKELLAITAEKQSKVSTA